MLRQQRIRIFAYRALAILAAASGCILLTSDASPASASARIQNALWQEIAPGLSGALGSDRQSRFAPQRHKAFQLNEAALSALLADAPLEFTEAAKNTQNEIALPMPDGSFARFRFVESPIMSPELAAQFPDIKTYGGWGIDDTSLTVRFDRTNGGFHAVVFSPQGAVYIYPLFKGDTRNYASFYARDAETGAGAGAGCLVGSLGPALTKPKDNTKRQTSPGATSNVISSNGGALRTFRLAVAATVEYTALFGGTVSGAMSNGITPTLNAVTGIYRNELSISLNIVSVLIFTAEPDPYTSNSPQLLIENQNTLDNVVGGNNYDIGHVFDANSIGGAAVSVGTVCDGGSKGQAFSGQGIPTPGFPQFFELLVAHEIGHQLGANHTFNGTVASCGNPGQRNNDTAVEPGSGSTIMAYPGLCGSDNIQSNPGIIQLNKDPYFHGISLAEINDYIDNQASCGMVSVDNNTPPSIFPITPYVIPGQTPFKLTASATDFEDTNLSYCWEHTANGSPGAPGADRGDNPLFRSWPPTTTSPARTFPRMVDLLNGTSTNGETLPATSRFLNFVVTVRDNHSTGGGFGQSFVQLNVASNAGPFVVTQPAAGAQALEGSVFTVTWDVANTTIPAIGAANVRILLSTNNGGSFPITLAASTPNDGSFTFIVPRQSAQQARIKVEAINNIFFNISPAFTIITAPTITATGGLTVTQGGPPVTARVATVGDARDAIGSLAVTASNLPPGVTLSLTNNNGFVSATATAQCISQLGVRPITLEVTNSAGLSARTTFNLDVDPNLAPALGSYINVSVTAGQSVLATPSAPPADANGNLSDITVRTTTPPLQGVTPSVHETTGVVTISTAIFAQPRNYEMEVEATDSCGSTARRRFFLTVLNSPPQITINPNSPARTTQGGTSTAPAGIASVSDGQDASGALSVSAIAPAGLTVAVTNLNGAVRATATAACSVAPGSYNATLTVTDSAGASVSATFVVIVDPNPPPTLGNYNNTGVTVGGTVIIVPNLLPSDPNNAVTLQVTPQFLPGGGQLTVNQLNGHVTVNTVAFTAPGIYLVKVFVRDACGAIVTKGFNLTVRTANCDTEHRGIYVADTGNHRIQRFNGVGWSVIGAGTQGSGLGQFIGPESVVASPDGRRIYVADTGNRRIQWSQDGGSTWAVFSASITPQGLALDRDGNLYASDALDNRVIRYPSGVPGASVMLATSGSGPGRVSNPNGLAIDCRMNLYIADTGNNRILVIATADATPFANTGAVVAGPGAGTNPAQVTAPQGVAVDNGGKLYVADTGNDRVLMIASAPAPGAATVLCALGPQPGQVRDPEGVTIAAFTAGPLAGASSIVVSDTNNNRIQGSLLPAAVWMLLPPPMGGGPGAGTGQFNLPSKLR